MYIYNAELPGSMKTYAWHLFWGSIQNIMEGLYILVYKCIIIVFEEWNMRVS